MITTQPIEVVLALPGRCWRRVVDAMPGTTAGEIVWLSGLDRVCEHELGEVPRLGVFGRKVSSEYVPQAGERLELYRELIADPRQRRRVRAQTQRRPRTAGSGAGSGAG